MIETKSEAQYANSFREWEQRALFEIPQAKKTEVPNGETEVRALAETLHLQERSDLEFFRFVLAEALYCAQEKRDSEMQANTNALHTSAIEQQRLVDILQKNGSLPLDARLDFLLDHPLMQGMELGHTDRVTLNGPDGLIDRVQAFLEELSQQRANIFVVPPDTHGHIAFMDDYYPRSNGSAATYNVAEEVNAAANMKLPPGQRTLVGFGPFRTVVHTRDLAYMNVDERAIDPEKADVTFRQRSVFLLDLRPSRLRAYFDQHPVLSNNISKEVAQRPEFQQFRARWDDLIELMIEREDRQLIPISQVCYMTRPGGYRPAFREAETPALFDVVQPRRIYVDKDTGELVREPPIIVLPQDEQQMVG